MAKNNKLQYSFVSGLISPRVYGRIDLPQYMTSLRSCNNFIVSPFGAAVRRSGTYYITGLEDQAKQSRLIPFKYSNQQTYILEFADHAIRFYKDQGIILQSRGITNGTFASGITGWTNNSTGTGTIAYDGTNHRLDLKGSGGNPAKATWSVLENYGIGTYTVTTDVVTNSVTYSVGTTSGAADIKTGTLTTGTGKTFTFNSSVNQDVYISFSASATAAIDNVSISNSIYKIDSPYAEGDLPTLAYDQTFDTLYLAHPSYAPYKLIRHGHDDWTLQLVAFNEPAWADLNGSAVTLATSGVTGSVTITASSGIFVSTDVGRYIRMNNTVSSALDNTYPGTASQIYFTIPFFPNDAANTTAYKIDATGVKTQLVYNAGAPGAGEFTVIAGQVKTGSTLGTTDLILIAQKSSGSNQWGYGLITAYTSATQVTVTTVLDFSGLNATTNWRLSAWGATTGYPSLVTIYNQRLWFANSSSFPSTIWGSNTADFESYRPDNLALTGTVIDSSAIVLNINTAAIKWLKGLKVLLAGCSDGVFEITSPSGGVSPLSVIVQKDMNTNCSATLPALTSDQVIFVESLGQKIYACKYYFQYSGFYPNEITKYYDNVAGNSTVVEMAYTEAPSRLLWTRREDGGLWSCTYLLEDQTTGWAQHTLGGEDVFVESIATIPGATYSELWMIVRRTINGGTKRFVEVLQKEYNDSGQANAFFVDAGATYDGVPVSTITNLGYLEGQTVSILGDGAAQNDKVVTSGEVHLDTPVSHANVGLPYTSYIETPYIEGGSAIGTSQIQMSRIHKLGIRFHETLGGQFGYDQSDLETIIFNSTSDVMDEAPPIASGDMELEFPHGSEKNYKAWIQQVQPYPMSVLCLIYKVFVSDN